MIKKLSIIIFFSVIIIIVIFFILLNMQKNNENKIQKNSEAFSVINQIEKNKIWTASFQLAWNELADYLGENKLEFQDSESNLVNILNDRWITKQIIDDNDYYTLITDKLDGVETRITEDIKNKFGISVSIPTVDKRDNSIYIYSSIYKECEFPEKFIELEPNIFGQSKEKVKYFGVLDGEQYKDIKQNVEVLYSDTLDNPNEYAVKIKTIDGDEVILYKTQNNGTIKEIYEDLEQKQSMNIESIELSTNDKLIIPYININTTISYEELCGKNFKNSPWYLTDAKQAIYLKINETGVQLQNNSSIEGTVLSSPREFNFNDRFVLFMKEKDQNKPYLGIIIDDTEVLEKE